MVTLDVPTAVADHVDVGSDVIIVTRDGRGAPVEGTVSSIKEPDESGTGDETTLLIALGIDVFEYQSGVRVSITGSSRDDVLWLPPEAIRSHDGKEFVIVVEGEGQRRVEVELGIQTENQVELSGDLAPGDAVAVP